MAVAHDVSSSAYSLSGVTSASWSHSASGSDRYVRVGIGDGGSATNQVSAITYGGSAMAQVGNLNASIGYACIYEKIAPSTGAQTVSITFSSAAYGAAGSSSYTGVHQTTASGSAVTSSASPPSVNVSSATGDMVSDCVKHYHSSANITVGADQTQRWSGDDGSFNENAAASDEAGASIVTMSWSASGADGWALVAANIIQSAGGGTSVTVSPSAVSTTFSTNAISFVTDQILSITTQLLTLSVPVISLLTEQILAQTAKTATFAINSPTVSIDVSTTAGVNLGTFNTNTISYIIDQVLSIGAQEATFSIPVVTVIAGGDVVVQQTTPGTLASLLNTPGVVTDAILDIGTNTLTFVLNPTTVQISTPTTGAVSRMYIVLGLR